ncbi:ComF family protein [Limisalsivibrio acetivorans]|uniref:ComF family protein n=1 Tax=Limisalsivibrio acetivorans TaxID=1304888 RepID=UPI0003B3443C|nr:ComF family protein [Limisalsivibrio acetivorans]
MLSEVFTPFCTGCGRLVSGEVLFCSECVERCEGFENFCSGCGTPSRVKNVVACAVCAGGKKWDRLHVDYAYHTPVRRLLKEIKFGYRIRGAYSLGGLIGNMERFEHYDRVIPVPSHYTRRLRRFVHPATSAAKLIAEGAGVQYSDALYRKRRTLYQWSIGKDVRRHNVKGAFGIDENCNQLKILLVDDIITTGSTVDECSAVLKRKGADTVDVYAFTGAFRLLGGSL